MRRQSRTADSPAMHASARLRFAAFEVFAQRQLQSVLPLILFCAFARNFCKCAASPLAWQTDLEAARRALAAHGSSWFRWLHRDYRAAMATIRGIMKGELPKAPAERLRIVDAVIETQAAARSLDDDPDVGQLGGDAFGTDWKGTRSDWAKLAEIVKWDEECQAARLPDDYRLIKSRLDEPER